MCFKFGLDEQDTFDKCDTRSSLHWWCFPCQSLLSFGVARQDVEHSHLSRPSHLRKWQSQDGDWQESSTHVFLMAVCFQSMSSPGHLPCTDGQSTRDVSVQVQVGTSFRLFLDCSVFCCRLHAASFHLGHWCHRWSKHSWMSTECHARTWPHLQHSQLALLRLWLLHLSQWSYICQTYGIIPIKVLRPDWRFCLFEQRSARSKSNDQTLLCEPPPYPGTTHLADSLSLEEVLSPKWVSLPARNPCQSSLYFDRSAILPRDTRLLRFSLPLHKEHPVVLCRDHSEEQKYWEHIGQLQSHRATSSPASRRFQLLPSRPHLAPCPLQHLKYLLRNYLSQSWKNSFL